MEVLFSGPASLSDEQIPADGLSQNMTAALLDYTIGGDVGLPLALTQFVISRVPQWPMIFPELELMTWGETSSTGTVSNVQWRKLNVDERRNTERSFLQTIPAKAFRLSFLPALVYTKFEESQRSLKLTINDYFNRVLGAQPYRNYVRAFAASGYAARRSPFNYYDHYQWMSEHFGRGARSLADAQRMIVEALAPMRGQETLNTLIVPTESVAVMVDCSGGGATVALNCRVLSDEATDGVVLLQRAGNSLRVPGNSEAIYVQIPECIGPPTTDRFTNHDRHPLGRHVTLAVSYGFASPLKKPPADGGFVNVLVQTRTSAEWKRFGLPEVIEETRGGYLFAHDDKPGPSAAMTRVLEWLKLHGVADYEKANFDEPESYERGPITDYRHLLKHDEMYGWRDLPLFVTTENDDYERRRDFVFAEIVGHVLESQVPTDYLWQWVMERVPPPPPEEPEPPPPPPPVPDYWTDAFHRLFDSDSFGSAEASESSGSYLDLFEYEEPDIYLTPDSDDYQDAKDYEEESSDLLLDGLFETPPPSPSRAPPSPIAAVPRRQGYPRLRIDRLWEEEADMLIEQLYDEPRRPATPPSPSADLEPAPRVPIVPEGGTVTTHEVAPSTELEPAPRIPIVPPEGAVTTHDPERYKAPTPPPSPERRGTKRRRKAQRKDLPMERRRRKRWKGPDPLHPPPEAPEPEPEPPAPEPEPEPEPEKPLKAIEKYTLTRAQREVTNYEEAYEDVAEIVKGKRWAGRGIDRPLRDLLRMFYRLVPAQNFAFASLPTSYDHGSKLLGRRPSLSDRVLPILNLIYAIGRRKDPPTDREIAPHRLRPVQISNEAVVSPLALFTDFQRMVPLTWTATQELRSLALDSDCFTASYAEDEYYMSLSTEEERAEFHMEMKEMVETGLTSVYYFFPHFNTQPLDIIRDVAVNFNENLLPPYMATIEAVDWVLEHEKSLEGKAFDQSPAPMKERFLELIKSTIGVLSLNTLWSETEKYELLRSVGHKAQTRTTAIPRLHVNALDDYATKEMESSRARERSETARERSAVIKHPKVYFRGEDTRVVDYVKIFYLMMPPGVSDRRAVVWPTDAFVQMRSRFESYPIIDTICRIGLKDGPVGEADIQNVRKLIVQTDALDSGRGTHMSPRDLVTLFQRFQDAIGRSWEQTQKLRGLALEGPLFFEPERLAEDLDRIEINVLRERLLARIKRSLVEALVAFYPFFKAHTNGGSLGESLIHATGNYTDNGLYIDTYRATFKLIEDMMAKKAREADGEYRLITTIPTLARGIGKYVTSPDGSMQLLLEVVRALSPTPYQLHQQRQPAPKRGFAHLAPGLLDNDADAFGLQFALFHQSRKAALERLAAAYPRKRYKAAWEKLEEICGRDLTPKVLAELARDGLPLLGGALERWSQQYGMLSWLAVRRGPSLAQFVVAPVRTTISGNERLGVELTYNVTIGHQFNDPLAIKEIPAAVPHHFRGGMGEKLVPTFEAVQELIERGWKRTNGGGEDRPHLVFIASPITEQWVEYPGNLLGDVLPHLSAAERVQSKRTGHWTLRRMLGDEILDRMRGTLADRIDARGRGRLFPFCPVVERATTTTDSTAAKDGRRLVPGTGALGPIEFSDHWFCARTFEGDSAYVPKYSMKNGLF